MSQYETMTDVITNEDLYLSSFQALERAFAHTDPQWLHRIRQEAIQSFAGLGFPNTRDEEWRFTNVAPLAKLLFQAAPDETSTWQGKGLERALLGDGVDIRLVFLNGHYCEALSATLSATLGSLPAGVQAGSLAAMLQRSDGALDDHLARYADYRTHPFVALNTAFWQDGAYLRFPKGTVLEKPVHLVYLSTAEETPLVSSPRTLIVAERESQVTVVESYIGLGQGVSFSNAVSEIVVGENAVLDHHKLLWENALSYHMATLQVYQDRSANFSSCAVSLGGALARNEVNAVLDAEGAECALNGLYLARDHEHVDNRTTLDHAKPHGSSRELYHGILDDHSTGVFNGRIIVRPGAQKTDAIQKNRNLLLSGNAVINTKPQLEIYNNDVRCTHGATIGQLDPEALFYLRARGIGYEDARSILIYAFAGDILERVRPAAVRTWIEKVLRSRLAQGTSRKEAV